MKRLDGNDHTRTCTNWQHKRSKRKKLNILNLLAKEKRAKVFPNKYDAYVQHFPSHES